LRNADVPSVGPDVPPGPVFAFPEALAGRMPGGADGTSAFPSPMSRCLSKTSSSAFALPADRERPGWGAAAIRPARRTPVVHPHFNCAEAESRRTLPVPGGKARVMRRGR
jgi:hypothetical protein